MTNLFDYDELSQFPAINTNYSLSKVLHHFKLETFIYIIHIYIYIYIIYIYIYILLLAYL